MRKLFQPILYVCGILALIMAALMLIPVAYALVNHDPELRPFLISALVIAGLGG